MLKYSSISLDDIDIFACSIGPGSFTGLRIGVTIAKTLAWSLNIPVVPVSSLEVLASTNFDGDYIIPYIDARRDFVFAGIYNDKLDTIINDQYINVNSLFSYLNDNKKYVFVGNDEIGLIGRIPSNVNLNKVISKHLYDEGVNPHSLIPNYLKKTEAEEKFGGVND